MAISEKPNPGGQGGPSSLEFRLDRLESQVSRTQNLAVAAVAAAVVAAVVSVVALLQPLDRGGFDESPIIVGDGSVRIESPQTPWAKWKRDGANQWQSPKTKGRIRLARRLGGTEQADCSNAAGCSVVVNFSDGTRVEVKQADPSGRGMMITSSRPFSDFTDSGTVLTYGDDSIRVVDASASVPDPATSTSAKTTLCVASPCSVKVDFR